MADTTKAACGTAKNCRRSHVLSCTHGIHLTSFWELIMQLGTELKNHHCARFYKKLTLPAVYRYHVWYHTSCWQEGAQQLTNATRLAIACKFQWHLPVIHNIHSGIV